MNFKLIIILLLFFTNTTFSQLNCKVTINIDNIQGGFKENLSNFASDIETYFNNNRWTSDDLPSKIDCNLNIFFTSGNSENFYTAQVFIASQRPIFAGKNPSEKSTILLRIFDDKLEFNYLKNQPLYRNENNYDPLLSFLNYYAYLILGFDYDSYSAQSGNPFFRKSMSICNQASGKKGWDRTTTSYGKFNLIEEILSPKFSNFRSAFFTYHFKGLDLLATKTDKGFTNLISSLNKIDSTQFSVGVKSTLLKTFFDTKYLEFVEVFRNYSDKNIFLRLAKIDQSHQLIYEEFYRRKEN